MNTAFVPNIPDIPLSSKYLHGYCLDKKLSNKKDPLNETYTFSPTSRGRRLRGARAKRHIWCLMEKVEETHRGSIVLVFFSTKNRH